MLARYIIGIDEAGRGPVAGPVTVGAVLIKPADLLFVEQEIFPQGIKDSKKLSHKKREEIFDRLSFWHQEGRITIGHVHVPAEAIDKKGISKAVKFGVKRVLAPYAPLAARVEVRLDGLLKAPPVFTMQETIVKGDERETVIALASVVAKVVRDRLMIDFGASYPVYGFPQHKGYGTKAHLSAVREHGLCLIHRRTFLSSLASS